MDSLDTARRRALLRLREEARRRANEAFDRAGVGMGGDEAAPTTRQGGRIAVKGAVDDIFGAKGPQTRKGGGSGTKYDGSAPAYSMEIGEIEVTPGRERRRVPPRAGTGRPPSEEAYQQAVRHMRDRMNMGTMDADEAARWERRLRERGGY